MKQLRNTFILLAAALLAGFGLASCSESDDTVEEFPNWQETNTAYIYDLFSATNSKIEAGDNSWKIIKSYSKDPETKATASNSIIVHIITEGTGSGYPLYTDTVRVHYRGRLLPSTSYTDGYVFMESYSGDFNPATCMPAKMPVAGTIKLTSVSTINVPDGLSTALQNMRIGDRWEVYIPQELGFGTTETAGIPAYSVLKFDLMLMAYYRPGDVVPDWKIKRK